MGQHCQVGSVCGEWSRAEDALAMEAAAHHLASQPSPSPRSASARWVTGRSHPRQVAVVEWSSTTFSQGSWKAAAADGHSHPSGGDREETRRNERLRDSLPRRSTDQSKPDPVLDPDEVAGSADQVTRRRKHYCHSAGDSITANPKDPAPLFSLGRLSFNSSLQVSSSKQLAASVQIFLQVVGHIVGYLNRDSLDRGVFSEYSHSEMTSLHDELERKLQDSNAAPVSLPLHFLKAITCDFSTESELGRGGYGVVYKGVLPSGKIIAVKKLFEMHLVDDKNFKDEVSSLMQIKHQHVVQFIGYCAETSFETIKLPSGNFIWAEIPKRLLCFEYLSNKSLDKYISVPIDESPVLDWNMRYAIVKGICNGLNFLHKECHMVHLDLKPENILMDATMMPKIADFGLSRIFGNQESRIVTDNSFGSRGYMAPEYLIQGIITVKADIFSLGVIIIEIMTGHRDYPYFQLDSPESTATSCQHFTEEVLGNWTHKFESTVKYISMEKYNQQVKQCIAIALKCVDPGMEKRPTVNDVIQVLNTVDQMEARKEMPSEMESKDNSLVLDDTSLSKELMRHSITKEMSNINTSDMVRGVKESKEFLLPTPLWTSSTSSQNHQEAAKESGEPQRASDNTSECTGKFTVLNTIASKDLAPRIVTGEMSINKTDGKVVDMTNFQDSLPTLLGSSASNQNYQEGGQAFSEPPSASGKISETEVILGSSMLLDVHPLELLFHFEPNKSIACSLDLTNNTDEQVIFGLMNKSDPRSKKEKKNKSNEKMCLISGLPLFGIVEPGTIYTLVLTTNKHEKLPQEKNVDLILQTTTSSGIITDVDECIQHLQNAEGLGNTVHMVTLKGVCVVQGETVFESIQPSIKIISMHDAYHEQSSKNVYRMDVNQIEPLIITAFSSFVSMRNYRTQKFLDKVRIPYEERVMCIKFVASKGWCLVGSYDGYIRVYNYKKRMEKTKSFKAHKNFVSSVAIHPTKSYVLSVCDTQIKLWDWDHGLFGWKCMQKCEEHSRVVTAVTFDPEDYNSFASASGDRTIKVWSLDSPDSKYTLSGHSKWVWCLEYFKLDGQQYLITGSEDKTAKIWDLQKKECVRTLTHKSAVRSVLPHPKLALLVTGTKGGDVYFWSSTNFRIKRVLKIGGLTLASSLAYLKQSRRFVIAHQDGSSPGVESVIEIRSEEEEGDSSGNSGSSISSTIGKSEAN